MPQPVPYPACLFTSPLPVLHVPGDGVAVAVWLNLAWADVEAFIDEIDVLEVDHPCPS